MDSGEDAKGKMMVGGLDLIMQENKEASFIDESKISFNQDEEGFSSFGEDDEDDEGAEAEAILLIQTQLKEIGALKLALA